MDIVQFNELREARKLRNEMLNNGNSGHHMTGVSKTIDLKPEFEALHTCLLKLHKKLKL
jgi:hypothetical protein